MDNLNEITILNLKKEIKRLKKAIKNHRYGLVWMDVPEAFEDDVENRLPIFKEVPELAIKNNDGKPTHILIEGDNYHALTCLNYTHKGKVDVVYIDPPYNTGSDGFRYKDKRILDKYPDGTEVPKDHPFRHSYWLSFMSKRLELAKSLLKKDGIIFISIDDNELAQLKIICDKIFNEKNIVGIFTWVRKKKGSHLSDEVRKMTEYVLAYKSGGKIGLFGEEAYKDKWQPLLKRTNSIKELSLSKSSVEATIPDGYYKSGTYGRGGTKAELLNDIEIKNGFVVTPFKIMGRYVWTQPKLDEELKLGTRIAINSIGFGFNVLRYDQNEKTKTPSTLINEKAGVGTNEDANEEIKNIFGLVGDNEIFTYAKPVSLIKYLINSITKNRKQSIIVDFFAGSGTTAHAVLDLNKEENCFWKRQFILVTDNENKIMDDVCYPRIKNIISGYRNSNKEYIEGFGNSLKYYKTAFIGKNNILNATDQDKIELAHNAGELLAIAENTLELVKQNKFHQLFEDGNKEKYTAVYFREELNKFDEFTEMIKELKKQTTVYVFSWGSEGFFEDFDDIDQIKVKTIPLPILEIYKQIYNLSTE